MSGRRNIIARALVLGTLLVAATTNFAGAAEQDFSTWLKGLRSEAAEKGIRAQTLDRALSGLQPIPRVIELDRKQPEFTLTFDQYISRVVPQSRVDTGKAKTLPAGAASAARC